MMGKKSFIAALCIGLLFGLALFIFQSMKPTTSPIPTTSLETNICEKIKAQFGDCKRILLVDTDSDLAFAETSSGIVPVWLNEELTDLKKVITPMMDFQEFKEERGDRGPIDWRANVDDDFSVIYGFAEDAAKTIVINNADNVQPNRFYVREDMYVWYATFHEKVPLPVETTVFDEIGQILSGERE